MNGKERCDFHKKIRAQIAAANNIDFTPHECTYEGDCSGTCHACDAEAQRLNTLIKEKESKGEHVIVNSLCEDWVPKHECADGFKIAYREIIEEPFVDDDYFEGDYVIAGEDEPD